MPSSHTLPPDDLALRVQHRIEAERREREPLALAYLTVGAVLVLCGGMFWVEFENISLALRQLFPTLRDGTSDLDGTHTLAFASVGAILCGDVLMRRASVHWSERMRRRIDLIGMVALALFAISAMALIPLSTWQANDSSEGGSALSMGTYLAFASMLAALFPLSMLTNFLVLSQLDAALAKIARSLSIDLGIGRKRRLLADRERTRTAFLETVQRQQHAPTDVQLAEEHAARCDAIIGHVRGQLRQVISARFTGPGTATAPFVATSDDLLNHMPIERLQDLVEYLATFNLAAIRQRILD